MTRTTSPRNPWIEWVYLALAVAGAILPWLANLDFIQSSGNVFDLSRFIALANANPAAQSLSRDLLIGASAITIWMVVEAGRLQMRGLWVALLCSATLAFACGAPLFLWMRERRLREIQLAGQGAETSDDSSGKQATSS
ncbi:DUF2834 domain-containing protein [Synechococcus sp. CS-1325]|uniref:DUF2834 domain-containing protein n=1 Tax=unclassified Synechococcus TaxID=2626047 RepID=UPI000DB45A91|nr:MULTISPECIES: DUF2834 domain-containing protein [unclassified Synechococcus]MCT0199738.1 DUF2834 domain-containing protein [Synechococcus sp. CS-1325]MCT0214242.1 DUF2834 domain-containing protein [Synechococcus sp. CS-1326]MCT0232572.1 DUF2834 domain-containing protein [Synechococcus sp. CS-1327]PZV01063.1 MAG: hypothetical protein DCF24_05135 [Cyanobium sp.]